MSRNQLEQKLISYFKLTLNPSSKWFETDVRDFSNHIKARTNEQLEQSLGNMEAMNNPNSPFNQMVDKEIEKMEKAGLYNIGNMKPENMLD